MKYALILHFLGGFLMKRVTLSSNLAHRHLKTGLAAVLLAGTFGAYAGTPAQAAPVQTDLNVQLTPPEGSSLPAWSRSADSMRPLLSGNVVYYQAGSKFTAADASKGKIKWTYSAKLAAQPVLLNQSLFIATTQGKIVKMNAKTGKVVWTKDAPGKPSKSSQDYTVDNFMLSGTTLYINDAKGLTKTSAANGKKIASFPKFEGLIQDIRGNQIFSLSVESGAYMRQILRAYDGQTGKQLWEAEGDHDGILGYAGGYLYARNIPISMDQGYAASIDQIDPKTGKVVKLFNYIPVDFMGGMSAETVMMADGYFYIVQRGEHSGDIQRIPVNAPSETKPETIAELKGPIKKLAAYGKSFAALSKSGTVSVFDLETVNLQVSASTKEQDAIALLFQDNKVLVQGLDRFSVVQVPPIGRD
ncbi:hypothetical protein B9G55_05065 [Saccharibacillus sp. O16]|nr:hypothetical protein B9G55_05065 [Saccharibacillus sp. O16]